MREISTMNWISEFEKEFNISKIEREYWRIIVGQEPYKQSVGPHDLISSTPKIYKSNSLGNLAFLVNNFIKVQDSLEMIFNLLCRDHKQSIKMISYLREKGISSEDFGTYLHDYHKLILINKRDFNNKLFKYIGTNNDNKFLFVGKQAGKSYNNPTILNNTSKGVIIHSSGVNLSNESMNIFSGIAYKRNLIYYESWYNLNENYLLNKTTCFKLQDFCIC